MVIRPQFVFITSFSHSSFHHRFAHSQHFRLLGFFNWQALHDNEEGNHRGKSGFPPFLPSLHCVAATIFQPWKSGSIIMANTMPLFYLFTSGTKNSKYLSLQIIGTTVVNPSGNTACVGGRSLNHFRVTGTVRKFFIIGSIAIIQIYTPFLFYSLCLDWVF